MNYFNFHSIAVSATTSDCFEGIVICLVKNLLFDISSSVG